MPIISILISLVIICLLFWGVTTIARTFGAPPQILVVVNVVFVIIAVLWLLSLIGYGPAFRLT